MSDQDQQPKRVSLQGEIQKRKTQEIQRQIEAKQIAKARGQIAPPATQTAPSANQAAPASITPKRVPQTSSSAQRTQEVQLPRPPRFTHAQLRILIGSLTALLIVIIAIGTARIASTVPTTATATFVPLPIVSASSVIDYLKNAGLGIGDIRSFPVPNDTWHASEEVQFEIIRGNEKGMVLLLSYESSDHKVPDIAGVPTNSKFKLWRVMTLSNVLLLISPETSTALQSQLAHHLTQYLAAPYRPFLSSPTPTDQS